MRNRPLASVVATEFVPSMRTTAPATGWLPAPVTTPAMVPACSAAARPGTAAVRTTVAASAILAQYLADATRMRGRGAERACFMITP